MKLEDRQKELKHYIKKFSVIDVLYGAKELKIGYDTLAKQKKVDHELLYFINGKSESKGIFVFSYDFFVKELKDREIKKILGHNFLNFRIHSAYCSLVSGKNKKVRINDIMNYVTKDDATISRNRILKRVLALAYYHGWDLERVDGIDIDYTVVIPEDFKKKLKQRFNVDIFMNLVDDKDVWFFINLKGDLVFVFKQKSEFSREDVEKVVSDYVKGEFGIGKMIFE